MIEDGLRALLLTFNAVTAITTTVRGEKLWEEDSLPAIVIDLDTEEPQNSLDGLGGLVKATVVVTCLAESKAVARALAEAVRRNDTTPGTGLAGYSGVAGDEEIDAAVLEENVSGYVADEDGSDTGEYAVDATYTIWYSEDT